MRLAAVIAIVAVVGVGLLTYLGPGPGPGGPAASPTPTPAGTAVQPSVTPSLSLEVPFSSGAFGYDALYPLGWEAAAGTKEGSAADLALGEPAASPAEFWDHFSPDVATTVTAALLATSTALPPGTSENTWIEAYQAPQVAQAGRACIPERATWDAVSIDGHAGGIYVGCKFVEAVVFVDGRVYVFSYVHFSGQQTTVETVGRELLAAFLGTVSLHPERLPASSPIAS